VILNISHLGVTSIIHALVKLTRMCMDLGACCATKDTSDVAVSSSTAQNNNATAEGDRSESESVLQRLTARQHHTPATRAVNCRSAGDHRQSATSKTETMTPRYDGRTASSRRATIRSKPTQTFRRLSVASATTLTQTPTKKHFTPTPSPADSHTAISEAGRHDHAHPVQRTCPDDVTRRPAVTSRGPLAATTNGRQSSSTAVRCRGVCESEMIADTGFTPQLFTWLRQVNRSLNPHRRHRWSD